MFWDNVVFLLQNYGNLFLVGTGYTLLISAITVFFGTIFGALLAIMRRSSLHIGPVYPLRILVTIYVEVIRGTPMLLQLYFFYFLLPSLVLTKRKLFTLPLSTYDFYGTYSVDYGAIMAALVMTTIPVIILYIFLQKQIINGVTAGAVKM